MMTRKIGSLFSGIGGLEKGLVDAGLGEVVWQVERDLWCRGILAKNYSNARRHVDVCDVGRANLEAVDAIVGGFPCQDVSVAGKGAGLEDGTRSGLWSEYRRIVAERAQSWHVLDDDERGSQRGMRRVLADLAALGFDAEWATVGAWRPGATLDPSRQSGRSLSALAKHNLLPTATASDAKASRRHGYMLTGHSGTTLLDATDPRSRDGSESSDGASLAPSFVEWMMGFPESWSTRRNDSELSEMPLFRSR